MDSYTMHKTTKDGIISFPSLQCWDPMSKVVTIAAQVNGKRVLCNITTNTLRTKYQAFEDDPMKIVSKHRSEIESAAKRLIEGGCFEQDGSIKIAYKDL